MQKPAKPRWLKSLFFAVPLGLIFGLPFPVALFISESKDWGKGNYPTYFDFAWPHYVSGTVIVAITIGVFWLICMFAYWLTAKIKARRA